MARASIQPPASLVEARRDFPNLPSLSRHRRFIVPNITASSLNIFLTFTAPVVDAVWPLQMTYPYTIFIGTGK